MRRCKSNFCDLLLLMLMVLSLQQFFQLYTVRCLNARESVINSAFTGNTNGIGAWNSGLILGCMHNVIATS